jgi:hypothetical protein
VERLLFVQADKINLLFFLCNQHLLHESLGPEACCGSSDLILPTFWGVIHGFLFPEVDRSLCVWEFYFQSVVRGVSSSVFVVKL